MSEHVAALPDDGLVEFIRESNRIEGIASRVTSRMVATYETLLGLHEITVADLEAFVANIQPGAVLRRHEGQNVRVGPHVPPPGGPAIEAILTDLLVAVRTSSDPHRIHTLYETLHPFTDGNGRSGRALWLWHMLRLGRDPFSLPFLHRWYYQSLQGARDYL